MNQSTQVHIFDDRQSLSQVLISYISELVTRRIKADKKFCMALSGGSLMDIMAMALDPALSNSEVEWSKCIFFWVDERWVPWQSSDSNYGTAKRRFLGRIPVPKHQIHAVDTTLPLEEAARDYTTILKNVFKPDKGQYPQFDLVLLGIGPDGHTASLFPSHTVIDEKFAWVSPVEGAPKPPSNRITLTLPVINSARHIAWVVNGPGKADIVARILNPPPGSVTLPAGRVYPSNGDMLWFIDRAAAAKI
jgi:6-phosphogluconolactonase